MKRFVVLSLTILIVISTTACSYTKYLSGRDTESANFCGTPDNQLILPIAKETFTTKLMNEMPQDENFVISPLSIKLAMSLAAVGATGDTQSEILKSIQVDSIEDLANSAKDLIYDNNGVEIANSVWLNTSRQHGVMFDQGFEKFLTEDFDAKFGLVTDETAVNTINSWVSEKTHSKIPTIVDEPDFVAALINAIYFNQEWKQEFNGDTNFDMTFNNADGTTSEIKAMSTRINTNFYNNGSVRIVEIPYAKGDLSMYLVLTNGHNIDIKPYLTRMQKKEVKIMMPKFKMEFSQHLIPVFKELGVQKAFIPGEATFDDMLNKPEDLYISDIIHKAYIDVNEKGTEAAAATAVLTDKNAIDPGEEEIVELFLANSPFSFYIINNSSEEILFAGNYKTANK